jgi:predicted nucleic-acid-binding Zn-ribbon protein
MKSGQCPKCKSSNVFMNEGGLSLGGHSGAVMIFTDGVGTPATCDNYVCADCGYFENYIVGEAGLKDVRTKWKKVK